VALFRNVDNPHQGIQRLQLDPGPRRGDLQCGLADAGPRQHFLSYPGAEMALTRSEVGATLNSLILFRLATPGDRSDLPGSELQVLPVLRSIALGDANGDGDDEVMMLRDPESNNISIKLVNPAGSGMRDFQQAIGFGGSTWNQVRMGDIDGDGRDEPVVLRQDRYRIYWQNRAGRQLHRLPRTYRTPSLAVDYDRPAMAPGNFDGPGVPANASFVVSPLQ